MAPCRHLAQNEEWFRRWLDRGMNASLGYLERNLDKRFDPRRLVEGARTAVVCAVGYKNRASEGYPAGCRTKIASYACAADYHATVRTMLARFFEELRGVWPGLRGRAFVDTAPLLEKQLAVEAGLGWIGRQSLLVTPRLGSFVVLGELILRTRPTATTNPSRGRAAAAAATASRAVPREPSSHPAWSMPAAASPATPSKARTPPRASTSTAGSSAATAARAAAPTTAMRRCTPTQRSIPYSIPRR